MAKAISLNQLAARVGKIRQAIDRDVHQLNTDIVASVARELAARTPVDTALARSNWLTSVGSPDTSIRFPYKSYASRRRRNRRGNFNTGGNFRERINTKSVEEQARSAMIRHDGDTPVYIRNNVPYIGRLNKGHSPQAPAGFALIAVSTGVALAVRKFKWPYTRQV